MRTNLFRNGAKNIKKFAQTTGKFFNESEIKETKEALKNAKDQRFWPTFGLFGYIHAATYSTIITAFSGIGVYELWYKKHPEDKKDIITGGIFGALGLTSIEAMRRILKDSPQVAKDAYEAQKKVFSLQKQLYNYRLAKLVKLFRK